jgi:predicted dehydrogenase
MPLRIALVGTGDAGRHHARALVALHAEGAVDFAAITSRDLTRADATLAALAAPPTTRAFADLDSLLVSAAIDAVILATPDGLHAEQAQTALAAGKHVLCEKPLALSSSDARRTVGAARATGRLLTVGYHLRHHAGHVAMRARLAELVGNVQAIDVRWAWPDPSRDGWRARGHAARWWSLAALGTHAIDLALWLAGTGAETETETPLRVRALTTPPDAPVDHAAEVVLHLPSGVLAHIYCAITHRETPRLLVTGDAGEIECIATLGARGDGSITHRRGRDAPTPVAFTPIDPYLAQLRDFARRITAGDTHPDVAALHNLEVLEAITASNAP